MYGFWPGTGWNTRQLARQIDSQLYERALPSRNRAALLRKGRPPKPEDAMSPEEHLT
jgi:predicted nuclease of restriction endonuclease-like (RecB) superfamily